MNTHNLVVDFGKHSGERYTFALRRRVVQK